MSVDALFDLPDGYPPAPVDPEPRTRGETLRARQHEAVERGQHPLSVALRIALPLHPAARRDSDRTTPGTPRCGSCALRGHLAGGNRSYPKCLAHPIERSRTDPAGRTFTWHEFPRASHGTGTDTKAWWPACRDYQPNDGIDYQDDPTEAGHA